MATSGKLCVRAGPLQPVAPPQSPTRSSTQQPHYCSPAARHPLSPPPGRALHKGHVAAWEEHHGQGVHLDLAVPQQDDVLVLGGRVQLPLVALGSRAGGDC